MKNTIMEVSIISRETIKPSSLSLSLSEKPFKISLLDQVTPSTYVPYIFFYPPPPADHIFSTKLKASLSETLTRFYPLSGCLRDNLFIDNFNEGVSYLEARVSCEMSEFLKHPNMTSLNQFLPCLPFRKQSSDDSKTLPQLQVQVNIFHCGGVAIGLCMSHKIADASSCAAFLNCWANIAGPENQKDVVDDDLFGLSSRFPAVDLLPELYTSMYDKFWFCQANCKTERFVFDEEAIATLKARARSELVENPSRLQALSGFIWKSTMVASRAASSTTAQSPRTSMMCQVVNLRRRLQGKPWVGKLFWWSVALHNEDAATAEEKELAGLVERGTGSLADTKDYFMKLLKEDEAFDAIGDHLKLLEEMYSYEDPDIYGFSSWVNLGLEEIDFGWGKPLWVGTGDVGSVFTSRAVLIEPARGKGIEAWITLDEKVLAELQNDPEFLAFASINPPIPYSKP